MDSLTQIVLGAAVGELTLGKKVGNRAMVWGAVGGTIPDLDVFTSFFVNDIQELAYHRGFSHSITFAVLGALVFGYLIHKMYRSRWHNLIATLGWLILPLGIIYFLRRIFMLSGSFYIVMGLLVAWSGYRLYRVYWSTDRPKPPANMWDWQQLMFWSLVTHPLLDAFTTYGTQLFQPFNDYRVAFNTISVADPLYTGPFLLSVIGASFINRNNGWRKKLVHFGLIWSCGYLILCVYHKNKMNQIVQQHIVSQGIDAQRFMTSPTILNNLLWLCVVETDDGYYTGYHSLMDTQDRIDLKYVDRGDQYLDVQPDDYSLNILRWFSNNYYMVRPLDEDQLVYNDMRYGTMGDNDDGEAQYIFGFRLARQADGYYEFLGRHSGPPRGNRREMIRTLWKRIKAESTE